MPVVHSNSFSIVTVLLCAHSCLYSYICVYLYMVWKWDYFCRIKLVIFTVQEYLLYQIMTLFYYWNLYWELWNIWKTIESILNMTYAHFRRKYLNWPLIVYFPSVLNSTILWQRMYKTDWYCPSNRWRCPVESKSVV